MTTPSTSLATLRPDLASSFEAFPLEMSQQGFTGLLFMPVIEVMKQAGIFGNIPIEELLKDSPTDRAPGASYNRGTGRFNKISFATEEHGFEEAIDDREAEQFAEFFDAEMLAAKRARDRVIRNYEKRVAALQSAIANATPITGGLWSVSSTARPIQDVKDANIAIYERTGLMANTLQITWTQFQHLKDVEEIVDRIKFWGGQDPNKTNINAAALAQAFGIDRVLINGAQKNTANENQAASLSTIQVFSEAYLARVQTSRDPREAGWGRTFHWGEDGSKIGGLVETYRDETRRSDIARNRMDTDEVVTLDDAAQKITGVLA